LARAHRAVQLIAGEGDLLLSSAEEPKLAGGSVPGAFLGASGHGQVANHPRRVDERMRGARGMEALDERQILLLSLPLHAVAGEALVKLDFRLSPRAFTRQPRAIP